MRILLLLCLLLASCSRPGAKPQVRIAVLASGIGTLPVYLAKSLGFFDQEGLEVQLEELSSTSKTMEALLGGSVEVAASTYEQTVQAAAIGRDVESLFLLFTAPTLAVVAAPGKPQITRIEHLKGRTVGVTGLGSASHTQLNMLLIRHGMRPSDITPVSIGTAATALAAVENGRVDAAILNSVPFETLRARRPDVKVLIDLRTAEGTIALFNVPKIPAVAAVASSRWLAANPDTARRLTRALAHAARWIHERSASQIAASLPPSVQTPGSDAALRALEVAMPAFSPDGRMPPGGPEAILSYLKLAVDPSLKVDLTKTYTNNFLEDASR